jgi:hypothetical protein
MEERAAQPQPAFGGLTLIAIAGVNIAHDLIRKPVLTFRDHALPAMAARTNSVGKPAFVLP